MNINLTEHQNDYAIFLPAVSSFYSTFVGKQRFGNNYVDPARLPANFSQGVEGLNFFDPERGYFYYKWGLYSAGHADIDMTRISEKDDLFRSRPRNGDSIVVGDSGGFQIGKGVWEGDWKDPNCPKAMKKRQQVLAWMDGIMDWGMILDIPAWVARSPAGAAATGISTYQEAVNATRINNDYFIQNRNGNCKFLNVLQGENHTEAEDWYQQMKDYSDPKKYPNEHFNGWSMGGQNMCDIHLVLKRLVALRFDGLLESGKQDWIHFLGTSKLEWACMLTDIQRAIRKYHNPTLTISFDCASPFLATANGQLYITNEIEHFKKWTYRMVPSVDDRKYALDTRRFGDVVLNDGIFKAFTESPISDKCLIKDVCIYKPGDTNKNGKISRTSWDSFSYAIQMGHNVWMHINAVQEANRQYDQNIVPNMLHFELRDREYFRDIVDRIFATDDRSKAMDIVDGYNKSWLKIIGTRGATGKKTINASTQFNVLFDIEESEPTHHLDDSGIDETNLLKLEESVG
jgi:hypothetical protein